MLFTGRPTAKHAKVPRTPGFGLLQFGCRARVLPLPLPSSGLIFPKLLHKFCHGHSIHKPLCFKILSQNTHLIQSIRNKVSASLFEVMDTRQENDASAPVVKRRRNPRAVLACERCRSKKYKCSEAQPCGHCKRMLSPGSDRNII